MAISEIALSDAPPDVETAAPRRFIRAVLRNRKAAVGAAILVLIAFVAAFPGLLAPSDPHATSFAQNASPSSAHLLGTTQLGEDVLSQLIWSTRLTLIVTLIVSAIATFLSMIIGVTAAYVGGVTDRVLTVVTDVFLILPVLPLLILLAAYLPPGRSRPGSFARRGFRCATVTFLSRPGHAASGGSTSSWSRSCRP